MEGDREEGEERKQRDGRQYYYITSYSLYHNINTFFMYNYLQDAFARK